MLEKIKSVTYLQLSDTSQARSRGGLRLLIDCTHANTDGTAPETKVLLFVKFRD